MACDADYIQTLILHFQCPEGFDIIPIPEKTHYRSVIYDFGVKCSDKQTKKLKCNSTTNCISHLRDCHQQLLASPSTAQQILEEETDSDASAADRAVRRMLDFKPPQGYTAGPVPDPSQSRSVMYSYGVKCTHQETQANRWYCFCDEVCSSRSLSGTGGISLRGNTSTNCIAHLRKVHGLAVLAIRDKRKRADGAVAVKQRRLDLQPHASTPVNYEASLEGLNRLSPLETSVKSNGINLYYRSSDSVGVECYAAQTEGFRCPPGYVLDPHVRGAGTKRSYTYDYGYRCICVATMELRWFCCASDSCRANSEAGLGGISMKGLITTNCASHLRLVHQLASSGGKRRKGTGDAATKETFASPLPIFDRSTFSPAGQPDSAMSCEADWFDSMVNKVGEIIGNTSEAGGSCEFSPADRNHRHSGINSTPGSMTSSSSISNSSSKSSPPFRPQPTLPTADIHSRSLSFS